MTVSSSGWREADRRILVAAAASLTDVLKEIGAAYQSKGQHKVNFNFGPSSGLARQIEEGAPADIFFSADLAQMDNLDKNGRLEPGTRKNLLSNQLVIIVPVGFETRHIVAQGSIEGRRQKDRACRAILRAGGRLQQ